MSGTCADLKQSYNKVLIYNKVINGDSYCHVLLKYKWKAHEQYICSPLSVWRQWSWDQTFTSNKTFENPIETYSIPKFFWGGGGGGLYVLKEVSYAHQSCIKKNIRNVLSNVLLLSWISKTVVLCCISLFLGLCLIESSKQQHFYFFTLCIFTVTLGTECVLAV